MTRWIVAVAVLIVIFFPCPVLFAKEASKAGTETEPSGAGNWDFSLAPMYLWAVAIDGEQTVKGNDVDLDVSFSDIFDDLNGALTFHFEGAHKSHWGFFTDLNYIVLNPEESTPIGDIDIEFTQILFELAGFYRWTEGPHTIDGFGGFRYASMDVELDFPGPRPKVDQDKDWVDPYLGMRWDWNFADRWTTKLRGDIGGFGIGSDLTYNLVGLIDFKPWKHVSLFGGYRVLYQDYSSGSGSSKFAYDATMHGPALGLNITW